MKISYSWLKDYVDIDLSAEETADKLTFCGLEVESVEKEELVKGGLEGVVVGEVVFCENHPDSDHLHITKVDVGGTEPLDIVCGAPNVAKGQKVPVATIGTTLYFGDKPITIKRSKLRGCVSEGMICAEDELSLGTSHDGIMVLDDDAIPGTPLKKYLGIEDEYVFEIGLTANRSDATGHIGVARDLAALLSLDNYDNNIKKFVPVKLPNIAHFKPDNTDNVIKVTVEDKACVRYAGVTVSGITVGDSPEWLKKRLLSIGIKPINNIVDISNFVLFETGHPLHTFDADKIKGKHVIVKKLTQNTEFVTLDNVTRKLSGNDLMICNEEEGMCMAGVYGGINSGITNQTKNIFIESAVFDTTTIRKTSKYHGLQTDASFRYERGVDPEMTIFALKRAALMIRELAGGTISSDIVDIYPEKVERKQVTVNFNRVNKLIGKEIPKEEMAFILQSMDFDILQSDDENLVVAVPTAKYDVYREADVVEEILRIYGYNNVEIDRVQNYTFGHAEPLDAQKIQNNAIDFLRNNEYMQIMTNSLCSDELSSLVAEYKPEDNVTLMNPLSKELNIMRRSLLFGGLQVIAYNINRKNKNLKLFEFGNTYSRNNHTDSERVDKRYIEENNLSMLVTGLCSDDSWYAPSRNCTFFDLKHDVVQLLGRLGLKMQHHKEEEVDGIFGKTLSLRMDKIEMAQLCSVPQHILKYHDIKQQVFFANINWNNLLKFKDLGKTTFSNIPKTIDIRRDLALVLNKDVKYNDIVKLTKSKGNKIIREMSLFDVYEGEKIEADKKSYAIAFTLRDDEKTLTDDQIDKIMEHLITLYNKELGATIR